MFQNIAIVINGTGLVWHSYRDMEALYSFIYIRRIHVRMCVQIVFYYDKNTKEGNCMFLKTLNP